MRQRLLSLFALLVVHAVFCLQLAGISSAHSVLQVPSATDGAERESESARSLVQALRALENEKSIAPSEGDDFWVDILKQLRGCVIANPMRFLRCQPVLFLMFVMQEDIIREELAWLNVNVDQTTLDTLLPESTVGDPYTLTFPSYPLSGNRIHQTYSLARFEASAAIKVSQLGQVVEFGGGYGALASTFFRAGFEGKYLIHDLPTLSTIQNHYLQSLGLPVYGLEQWNSVRSGIFFSNSLEEIKQLGICSSAMEREEKLGCLTVGLFSLSEVPPDHRLQFLESGPGKADFFLFLYQTHWRGLQNSVFFDKFIAERKEHKWESWEDYGGAAGLDEKTGEYRGRSRFLVGSRSQQ